MKRFATTFRILCVMIILAAPVPRAWAESARSLVDRGNELYAAGKFDEALKAYEEAAEQMPESGEVLFNKGNACFLKGDYEKAREAYEAAALHARDPSVEARSQFNLGNTAFARAGETLKEDVQKALDQYGLSVRHYQNALRIDPDLEAAAENIEMARLQVKDLLDRIKNREEEAKERQKQQEELKKQLREAIKDQEANIADNDSLRDKMAQAPDTGFHDELEKLASGQGETRDKTEKIARQIEADRGQGHDTDQGKETQGPSAENADSKPGAGHERGAEQGAAVAEHVENALGAQESALEGIGKSDLDGAHEHQEKALQELKDALARLEELGEKQPENQDNKGDGKQGQKEEPEKQGEQQPEQQSDGQDQGEQEEQDKQDKQAEQTQQGSQGRQDDQGENAGQDESASPRSGQAQSDERGKPSEQRQEPSRSGKEGEGRKAVAAMQEKPEDILREERENRLQFERSRKGGYRPADKDW